MTSLRLLEGAHELILSVEWGHFVKILPFSPRAFADAAGLSGSLLSNPSMKGLLSRFIDLTTKMTNEIYAFIFVLKQSVTE